MKKKSKIMRCKATCETCGIGWTSRNSIGLAAQHAKKYGHKVVVEVTNQIIFEGVSGDA